MSRAKRTQQFRKTVEKKWTQKYWAFIQENQDKSWYWMYISSNPNMTWEIIRENPDKPWNWDYISGNPNITWNTIRENPDKPWSWKWISSNPNITFDIIRENPDKPWVWEWISYNEFQKEKELFIEKEFREYIAAYKIQNWWIHITMSPYYKIGRKFIDRDGQALLNEYNEIVTISYE